MNEEIFCAVKEILLENFSEYLTGKEIEKDAKLVDLGINSMAFIKTVVGIEEKYDIEFDDEELEVSNYETMKDFVDFIEKKISEKD